MQKYKLKGDNLIGVLMFNFFSQIQCSILIDAEESNKQFHLSLKP